jgi:hypothetical protein
MATRFNQNHAAAGSANGGQFASASGSGAGKGKSVKAGPKAASSSGPDAHQQHEAHLAYLANHPDTPGARADRKAALLEAAKADRAKIDALEKQLKGLQQQEAKAVTAARHAKAAAASAHAGPRQKRTLAHAAASTSRRHASVKSRISALQDQIGALRDKVKAEEAQAAKL